MTDGELKRLEADNQMLRTRLDRLTGRKSVRVALTFANSLGRLRKRFGLSAGTSPSETESVAEEPKASESTHDGLAPPAPVQLLETEGQFPDPFVLIDLLEDAPPVWVLVPVFNAYEELRACVESLIAYTSTAAGIILINDGSTDERVYSLLGELAEHRNITVLENVENLGFVRTVNRGFDYIDGDVLLLNADTVVGPRYVEHLRLAAYADPLTASATAFSDNAGAFSAPLANVPNPVGPHLDAASAARLVSRAAEATRPSTPTASGFCMYIKRRALDQVGGFDPVKYPRGYGEENDWSMRATAIGWNHVVDDASYVVHVRSASFGDEKAELARSGREQLRSDWPEYSQLVKAFSASPAMDRARSLIGSALGVETPNVRPRVLYTLHNQGGGTPATSQDLAQAIDDRYEPFILRSTGSELQVDRLDGTTVARATLDPPLQISDTRSPTYRAAVARLLIELNIEIVHIRHLMHHALDLPATAKSLGIPVVLSIHDFYLVCPTAHLLDERGLFCGGTCTPGQGVCPSVKWVGDGPHLKHSWVNVWRHQTTSVFDSVDAVVAANEATRDLFIDMLPRAGKVPWSVIEHGRDLIRSDVARPPVDGEPIRILLAGHMWAHKGADLLASLIELDRENRLEFHLAGSMPAQPGVVVHGVFERDRFAEFVADIRPAAMAILSTTAETYSHTMTEGWSVGLPIIATDLGAPANRIRAQGGGWLISSTDAAAAYERILSVLSDPDEYRMRRSEAARAQWPSTAAMAERYAGLYDEVLGAGRTAGRK